MLCFPTLEPWVAWSVLLPSCSSQFICMQIWDHRSSSRHLAVISLHLRCPSPPLLPVRMNVSLTPWLLDFHTVQFSGSAGCFLFLNCCCPSFGCVRRQSVPTYASILARSLEIHFSQNSGEYKLEIKVSTGWVSSEASLLGL